MKYLIEKNIVMAPTSYGNKPTEKTLALREALMACEIGDSFIVGTLREAQTASILASRLDRKTSYRKQLDGSRRVWVIA
jgi:hypothetical protein